MTVKHFMMFYLRGSDTFIVTEPRPWAKENQNLFPDYDFLTRFPSTKAVEDRLIIIMDLEEF